MSAAIAFLNRLFDAFVAFGDNLIDAILGIAPEGEREPRACGGAAQVGEEEDS